MKRLHVSLNVSNLDQSIAFYTNLFGQQPTFVKSDYAKSMLDDPRVNFVLEHGAQCTGLTHAGIQAESDDELREVFSRMKSAEIPYLAEGTTACCYAKSEKSWTVDPDGLPWEAFYTHHQLEERGEAFAPELVGRVCCQ